MLPDMSEHHNYINTEVRELRKKSEMKEKNHSRNEY